MRDEDETPEDAASESEATSPAGDVKPVSRGPRRISDGDGDSDDGGKQRRGKRYTQLSEGNKCRFTEAGVTRIDYKDVVTLQKLMTAQGKIFSRKRTGVAARYQRMVKKAIKRARFMALLPYTG